MHFLDAQHLMQMCGAARYLLVGSDVEGLAGELTQRGGQADITIALSTVAVSSYDCIVVDGQWMLEQGPLEEMFVALHRVNARWLMVRFSKMDEELRTAPGVAVRAHWENAAVASGFRRAPQAVSVARYKRERGEPQVPAILEFERVPDAVLSRWPLEKLLIDRDLHMDMSRESGARSDAHMVRYALAASLIRPGDTVLDCACGLGYGSAIMAAQSIGNRFIGVDLDSDTISYASANFEKQYGIEYHAASATDLSFLEDDSIDLLVSFETIEHLQDYESFLIEARRVLKPDGRIIGSVPNLWVDETGEDPNPHHYHAFDYQKFRSVIGKHFIVEDRWSQTAPGGFKLWDAPRTLNRLPLDAAPDETEWLILVASVDPLAKVSSKPYHHPAFSSAVETSQPLVAFAEHYNNPWLYRSMVQLGERLRDGNVLNDLAAQALQTYPTDSADFGAALTVLGYALLEQPDSPYVNDVRALAGEYITVESANPHVRRWQISAAYVAARLALMRADRENARALFRWISDADFLGFSPLLATKVIASQFQLGAMALADQEESQALEHFRAGVATCRVALAANDEAAIGNPAEPLSFGFSELAEVADMGAQCATAIKLLPLHKRSPGAFWCRVDTKRFGVVSWAQAVERENQFLRMKLGF
jgi:2-polyprenyl-3-methyl-5-hydroxy-6-metoxy-1,4-benzoquinol methylase